MEELIDSFTQSRVSNKIEESFALHELETSQLLLKRGEVCVQRYM